MEEENRRRAEELVERRDSIRASYEGEEEARRLRQLTEEYEADVQRKAVEIEKRRSPAETGTSELRDQLEHGVSSAQENQVESEASDFEALAGQLTSEFAEVAANVVPEDHLQALPNTRRPASPAGPVSSA